MLTLWLERPAIPDGQAGWEALWGQIDIPRPERLWAVAEALRRGASIHEVCQRSRIDPWFVGNLAELVTMEDVFGVLHNHTTDSDGVATVAEMAASTFSPGRWPPIPGLAPCPILISTAAAAFR